MLRMFHDSGFSNNHNEAVRLAAELPRYGINVPVQMSARKDDTRWAVAESFVAR